MPGKEGERQLASRQKRNSAGGQPRDTGGLCNNINAHDQQARHQAHATAHRQPHHGPDAPGTAAPGAAPSTRTQKTHSSVLLCMHEYTYVCVCVYMRVVDTDTKQKKLGPSPTRRLLRAHTPATCDVYYCIGACMHACSHACTHSEHVCMHAHTDTHTHTHAHTRTHTHTRTYIHTHILTNVWAGRHGDAQRYRLKRVQGGWSCRKAAGRRCGST